MVKNTQTESGPKPEGLSFLRLAGGASAIACVGGVYVATQMQIEQGVPVAIGAGAITLTCATIGVLMAKRKKNRTRLAAILATELGADWDPAAGLKLSRFTKGSPRKIVLTYPARMPDHDPKWRAKLRDLVQLRMGVEAVKDAWDLSKGRAVFEAVEWTAAERELRQADKRLGAGLDTVLGAGWDPAEGMAVSEYRGAAPRKITLTYPLGLPDHEPEWRERVADLVRQRMGADDVTTTWIPEHSRVVIVGVDWTAAERSHKTIERRIQKILTPLFRGASHLDVNVPAWTAEAFPLRIDLDYGTITQDASEVFQRRVEVTAGVKVGGRWRAVFDPRTDSGYLEPRPEFPANVRHPGLSLYAESDPAAPVLYYGQDENGRDRGWTIGKKSTMPHMLAIGPTGAGKTTVLRSLVVGAVAQGIPVFMCDPKRVELTPFRGFPGCFVASAPQSMALMIEQMESLMQERYKAIEDAISRREQPPVYTPVLFILDELLILRQVLKRHWSEPDENGKKRTGQPPWFESIAALLALARTAMINVVIGVQRPDAELFDKGARDNLRQRCSLMRLSPQGSQMLWGSPYVGVDLPMVQGRAMASPDGETPVEMQTYWVADPITPEGEDKVLIDQIRARGEELFADYTPPIDVSVYTGMLRYADDAPVADIPRSSGEISLGLREDEEMAAAAADRGIAGLDVDEVQADALTAGDDDTPGDRILHNDEPCEVLSVEEDFTGMVVVTISTSNGEEQLELTPDEYVPRVLDLDAVAA